MKDDPASMLNRLGWLLSADCALDGGAKPAVSVNCPSADIVHRDTKSVRNVVTKINRRICWSGRSLVHALNQMCMITHSIS